jgi:hypothetical protein
MVAAGAERLFPTMSSYDSEKDWQMGRSSAEDAVKFSGLLVFVLVQAVLLYQFFGQVT